MNYQQTQNYLLSIRSIGIVPGLDTMRELLGELGNPQNDVKVIHLAGTNGKGSVGAFLSYVLAASGYRVGRYLSPAVYDEREKIQTLEMRENGNDKEFCPVFIKKEDVARHISRIKAATEKMVKRGLPHPSLFETETAMAFLELREKQCDVVVLETGMGGLLDATNVVTNVECCVFVPISMDHMSFLGNTLEDIAAQKAGIIKQGVPVISSPQKSEVEAVLRRKAKEMQSELFFADCIRAGHRKHSLEGIDFTYDGENGRIPVHLSLLGNNQIENALTAIETLKVLKEQKRYHITRESLLKGLANTVWHGRFEVIKREPVVIIDGAHNEDAAQKLAESVRNYFFNEQGNLQSGGKLICVMGIFRDKEVEKVIKEMLGMADIVLTVTPDSPRGLNSAELKQKAEAFYKSIGKNGDVRNCKTVASGVKTALELAKKEDVIIIFGSLSLMHEVSV